MASTTADREIVVTRVFNAPRELVFAAFTQQEHAEQWWIPNGTTHEWNGQPGGIWRYSTPGPGGAVWRSWRRQAGAEKSCGLRGYVVYKLRTRTWFVVGASAPFRS